MINLTSVQNLFQSIEISKFSKKYKALHWSKKRKLDLSQSLKLEKVRGKNSAVSQICLYDELWSVPFKISLKFKISYIKISPLLPQGEGSKGQNVTFYTPPL